MKVLYVPSKYNLSFSLKNIKTKKMPNILGLITTIQHIGSLKKIKNFLENQKKKAIIGGQILGCDMSAAAFIQHKVQAFLYIGSGKFHPLQLALTTNKPIFIFNPLNEQFSELDKKQIQKIKARKKSQKIKFLSADIYGILVSTKPGQNKFKKAQKLKNKLEKQNKKAYIFLFNDFDINQIENFPKIECWINTACPGLSLENPFVWINDIKF